MNNSEAARVMQSLRKDKRGGTNGGRRRKCPECGGRGHTMSPCNIKCQTCEGTGKLPAVRRK